MYGIPVALENLENYTFSDDEHSGNFKIKKNIPEKKKNDSGKSG